MPSVCRGPSNPCVVGVRAAGNGAKARLNIFVLDILIEGAKVEQVKEFVYLGSLFANNGIHDRDIEKRVHVASIVIGALLGIMNSKSISRQARLAIHNGVLIPTPMYGSETGPLPDGRGCSDAEPAMLKTMVSQHVVRKRAATGGRLRKYIFIFPTYTGQGTLQNFTTDLAQSLWAGAISGRTENLNVLHIFRSATIGRSAGT
ncbi:hypothetical protein EVAR_82843_1 [Eumeta japonica]|uniref:Uncharacterized protein n=1 Tax=Eumeta variegata TaxID=151549 RepID=A0A4C1V446_EUMVA|nr:hypothetical protein EVAR_82843_1 [Eumeta japonica]